jgi:hypothetical protein
MHQLAHLATWVAQAPERLSGGPIDEVNLLVDSIDDK